ncbi:MAG: alpha amylase C-terminal domain-containing protein, partial [Clostridia bacterium]|nr:alpha amylase C-terminal domain-containing protein [Clostridia bacterium]
QEFGQFIEWNYKQQLDWLLLDYDKHRQLQHFFKTINELYLKNPALWEIDYSWEGFSWIANDDNDNSVIAFRRIDKNGKEIVVICNFTSVFRSDYKIGVARNGTYKVLLNTDDEQFGGAGTGTKEKVKSVKQPMHNCDYSISLDLPGNSVLYLTAPQIRRKKVKNEEEDK